MAKGPLATIECRINVNRACTLDDLCPTVISSKSYYPSVCMMQVIFTMVVQPFRYPAMKSYES